MLEHYSSLMVQQQVEMLQVFSGFETNNRYKVLTPDGAEVLYAFEQSGALARQFMRTHRPLAITVMDTEGNTQMTAHRGFFWLFSHLELRNPQGIGMGRIDRRFKFPGRKYDVTDGQGQTLELVGPLMRPHTFILRRNDVELGRVTKRWTGLGHEMFTTADTFQVAFEPSPEAGALPQQPLSESMRWVMLAAAIAIDIDFFENRGRRGGAIQFGTR